MSVEDDVSEWIRQGDPPPPGIAGDDFRAEVKRQIEDPVNLYRVLAKGRHNVGLRQADLALQGLQDNARACLENLPTVLTPERAWQLVPDLLGTVYSAEETASIQALRLGLLGVCARSVLGGALPTPRGWWMLAALAQLDQNHSFYLADLGRFGLADDQVNSARAALTQARDSSPLQAEGAIGPVVEAVSTCPELSEALDRMGVDQELFRWAHAASAVSPRPTDPWASLSHAELLRCGPEARCVVSVLMNAAEKEQIALDPGRLDITALALWGRADHFAQWSNKPDRVPSVVSGECHGQLEAGSSTLGAVLLHLLMRAYSAGDEIAWAAAREIGLSDAIGEAIRAYRQADWAFFRRALDRVSDATRLGVARGSAPDTPAELHAAAETLISESRRLCETVAVGMLAPRDAWLAQVSFQLPDSAVPAGLAMHLDTVRRAITGRMPIDTAGLSELDRFELARLARSYGLSTEDAIAEIVERWVADVHGKLTVEGAARKNAMARLETARCRLVEKEPAQWGPLERALQDRRAEPFESAGVVFPPKWKGVPSVADIWRRLLMSPRFVAPLVFVLVVLYWMTRTYVWPASHPPAGTAPNPDEDMWGLIQWNHADGKMIATQPVPAALYKSIAATSGPAPSEATLARVTFPEAKRWCEIYEAMLRTQRPDLFEPSGALFGRTARMPIRGEVGAGAVPGEWSSGSGARTRVGDDLTSGSPAALGALGYFRVVFAKEAAP